MKLIEKYNELELTNEEYETLCKFLKPLGIDVRKAIWSCVGCTVQATNPYKEFATNETRAKAEDQLESGYWKR